MFVLDPNVVSELRKAGDGRADPHVTAWLAGHDAGAFFLSAITVLELGIGVEPIERRDPVQGALLRAWLDGRVLPEFDGRVPPVDTAVALLRPAARARPRADRDALIAATALGPRHGGRHPQRRGLSRYRRGRGRSLAGAGAMSAGGRGGCARVQIMNIMRNQTRTHPDQ